MRLLGEEVNTIWKFVIPIEDEFCLDLPVGALPLSVGWQKQGETRAGPHGMIAITGQPVLWAAVNGQTPRKQRHRFFLRGTGHPFPGLLLHRFVGTFTVEPLGLVYHLFDVGPEEEMS